MGGRLVSFARATLGLKRCGIRVQGACFAPGAHALGRASLDGRSQKVLTRLLVGQVIKRKRECELTARSRGSTRLPNGER